MTLQEFIAKYNGVPNVGNTPGNKGECVGLVAVWVDNLSKSHIWGDAKDLFNNAPPTEWEKIENSPTEYPKAGDIMCWGASWGGGYGHTGIVESSSPATDSFVCLEQNYPTGSPPHLVTRKSWNGIIGWLRPIGTTPDDCEERLNIMTINRNEWKEKADGLEVKIEEEREAHGKEIAAKEKIIESQQILVSELNSKAVSDDKTISTITSERDTWKTACTKSDEAFSEYRGKITIEMDLLNKKLADSHVKIVNLEKPIKEMSWVTLILTKLGRG